MTFDEYLIAFSGRWEAVGFIITMFGICAAHTTVDDPLFNGLGLSAADHKNLGILATAGSDRCLQFCDSMGVMGDALGWLLLQHINLLTLVCGDYDYRPRKRLGELSTLLFAMGYHQLDTGDDLPFFLAEGRKRLMVSAYTCDKALATFLGCPPLIAYRFCRIQPPLDLAPAELVAEPVVREAAIRKLDSQGWNTKGFIKGSSWSRISLRLAHVRELVMELSLDSHYQNIWKQAEEISHLFSQVRSELPSFLRWDERTESALRLTNTFPIYIHLDLLYSNFLLQRILVKHSLTGPETLISLAHQILTATLTQIAIGQRCSNPFSELGWLIPYFGLPSAGILAIELLRLTQNPQLRLNETPFPRSEVIQNLSILVSHIQYIILPQKGNYEICQQGRKVISYILEYVLDQPPTDVTVSVPPVVPNNLIPPDWLADEWLNDGTDFIKWIDGLDWDEDNEL
ncbi:putative chromatin structure remodeling complex protein RSC3 [Talaromyces proteolyticus]|uniref:Chromatin structure remodeling complex protein RSC3 n=1 Tax=Talaromyces proteolyticus TaxID=1131652 RepID=A0AAD4KUV6_9EURO|nr:putative chromatin structure remodeling complex protein RSC3 [Talaromyces proteolyticus]KAH8697480.1 putative chromatin structure remodeling complex protein RSC3 [Talaromyces proteolyticus]